MIFISSFFHLLSNIHVHTVRWLACFRKCTGKIEFLSLVPMLRDRNAPFYLPRSDGWHTPPYLDYIRGLDPPIAEVMLSTVTPPLIRKQCRYRFQKLSRIVLARPAKTLSSPKCIINGLSRLFRKLTCGRGTAMPLWLTLIGSNEQAPDLLSAPKAIKPLFRSLTTCSNTTNDAEHQTNNGLFWGPENHRGHGRRVLQDEVIKRNPKPSTLLPRFTISVCRPASYSSSRVD